MAVILSEGLYLAKLCVIEKSVSFVEMDISIDMTYVKSRTIHGSKMNLKDWFWGGFPWRPL